MYKTKNQQVRELVAQREYKKALQICKDWDYKNPLHRKILGLGYECHVHPRFYQQLGVDTTQAYEAAVEVLKRVYGRESYS